MHDEEPNPEPVLGGGTAQSSGAAQRAVRPECDCRDDGYGPGVTRAAIHRPNPTYCSRPCVSPGAGDCVGTTCLMSLAPVGVWVSCMQFAPALIPRGIRHWGNLQFSTENRWTEDQSLCRLFSTREALRYKSGGLLEAICVSAKMGSGADNRYAITLFCHVPASHAPTNGTEQPAHSGSALHTRLFAGQYSYYYTAVSPPATVSSLHLKCPTDAFELGNLARNGPGVPVVVKTVYPGP
jgi:hypothetical protein